MRCWNCGQPLTPECTTCPTCGMSQDEVHADASPVTPDDAYKDALLLVDDGGGGKSPFVPILITIVVTAAITGLALAFVLGRVSWGRRPLTTTMAVTSVSGGAPELPIQTTGAPETYPEDNVFVPPTLAPYQPTFQRTTVPTTSPSINIVHVMATTTIQATTVATSATSASTTTPVTGAPISSVDETTPSDGAPSDNAPGTSASGTRASESSTSAPSTAPQLTLSAEVSTDAYPRITLSALRLIDQDGHDVALSDLTNLHIYESVQGGAFVEKAPLPPTRTASVITVLDVNQDFVSAVSLSTVTSAARTVRNALSLSDTAGDAMGVVVVGDQVRELTGLSQNGAVVDQAIAAVRPDGQGRALYDGLKRAVLAVSGATNRRAVVAIVGGVDQGSQASASDVINAARERRVAIHIIEWRHSDDALGDLARATGGRFVQADADALGARAAQSVPRPPSGPCLEYETNAKIGLKTQVRLVYRDPASGRDAHTELSFTP